MDAVAAGRPDFKSMLPTLRESRGICLGTEQVPVSNLSPNDEALLSLRTDDGVTSMSTDMSPFSVMGMAGSQEVNTEALSWVDERAIFWCALCCCTLVHTSRTLLRPAGRCPRVSFYSNVCCLWGQGWDTAGENWEAICRAWKESAELPSSPLASIFSVACRECG